VLLQVDDKRLLVFGGLDKRTRFNDVWVLQTDSKEWLQLPAQGPCPEPRAHFTATKVGGKVFVFGGYGGAGQVFNDLWALSISAEAASWENLSSQLQGTGPSPRFDHAAYVFPITPNNPTYDRLVVAGGRDLSAVLLDSFVLDLGSYTWLPEATALPLEACNSICDGVTSVPFHKVFSFGGKRGMMNYLNTVEVMDCGNQVWNTPLVQGTGKPPCGR
jgi:dynein heavy chain